MRSRVWRFLRHTALLRGPFGGSRMWTAVYVAGTAYALMRRLTGDRPEIVYRTELRDRDAIVISSRPDAPVTYHH